MQKDYLQGMTIETVYFGGGTPSLLTADDIKHVMECIYRYYPIKQLKECTLESNPDDLDTRYLASLRDTPISRLSIGVQSFHDSDLKYMHRAHNAQQADYAIKAAQDAGFGNLTIDLIYGTPALTNAGWKQNLSRVRELQIPHFSSYALTVEEGTALHHSIHKKHAQPVDAEQAAQQFEILMEQAAYMGYEHYEISNLALPNCHAIHNTNYWKGLPYLGVGPSAHSFDGINRRWNVANNAQYANSILQDHKLLYEQETLTPIQHLNEYIMTSLRTMWGCDMDKITKQWGSYYAKEIHNSAAIFQDKKWLTAQDNTLALTPAGKLFADKIASELFVVG